jgi:hypothetical protein
LEKFKTVDGFESDRRKIFFGKVKTVDGFESDRRKIFLGKLKRLTVLKVIDGKYFWES